MYTREQVIEKSTEYFKGDTLAAGVFVDKYALTDGDGNFFELTPDDMHKRLAREFARIEQKYPNPLSENEIYDMIKNFSYVVPQGSPMAAVGNPYQIQSTSNCFVIEPPHDSYGGICKTDQELVQLAKRRSGIGIQISGIRPKGMKTKNAAKTTDGIAIFMERFSNSCREVAQSGRRGALIQILNVKHPEIETFINIKKDRTKITGANISVLLTDDFMNAVKNDTEYEQKWPIDSDTPQISRMVKARIIWEQIVHNAWENAEPGLLFWDNVLKNTPSDVYPEFRSVGTNPCFVGDTLVVVKIGEEIVTGQIKNLVGKTVKIYNGETWVDNSGFRVTGENQEILTIQLKNHGEISCTKYHKFILDSGEVVIADDLVVGNKLKISDINVSEGSSEIINIFGGDISEKVYCTTVESNNTFTISVNGLSISVKNCGEINLCGNDSCRLISMNLLSFVENKFEDLAYFNYEKFSEYVINTQRMMDDLIDLELESVDGIIAKIISDPEPEDVKYYELNLWKSIRKVCENGRRTGLGITALADTLAAIGILYGSKESVVITEKIYKTLETAAYSSSIIMAEERGSFPRYDYELEKDHAFISKVVGELSEELQNKYSKFGRRNIALTTTAPVGSVSILTQTSSGIEPVFKLSYKRRRKIMNDSTTDVDFVDGVGDKWQEYKVFHHQFNEWTKITGKTLEEESPWYKGTSEDVDWETSVELQAAAQRWVCHSISKTCNLPNDISKEVVANVYMKAWESGCKGFTVYRDGSRDGVLISNESSKKVETFVQHNSPKRPEILPCEIHNVKIKGESWTIMVGMYDDKPFEVFGGKSQYVSIPKKIKNGFLIKNPKKKESSKSVYDLKFGEIDDPTTIKNIAKVFENPTEGEFTRLISLALRHGSPVVYVVEQMQKEEDSDMYSFSKVLARVLKEYIKEGTTSTLKCPNCGAKIIFSEGCKKCSDNCGYAACG